MGSVCSQRKLKVGKYTLYHIISYIKMLIPGQFLVKQRSFGPARPTVRIVAIQAIFLPRGSNFVQPVPWICAIVLIGRMYPTSF